MMIFVTFFTKEWPQVVVTSAIFLRDFWRIVLWRWASRLSFGNVLVRVSSLKQVRDNYTMFNEVVASTSCVRETWLDTNRVRFRGHWLSATEPYQSQLPVSRTNYRATSHPHHPYEFSGAVLKTYASTAHFLKLCSTREAIVVIIDSLSLFLSLYGIVGPGDRSWWPQLLDNATFKQ